MHTVYILFVFIYHVYVVDGHRRGRLDLFQLTKEVENVDNILAAFIQ